MKKLILLFYLIIPAIVNAQKPIEPTNQFTIMGMVDKPKIVSYSDLEKEKIIEIGDFKITNHLGEFKKEYKNVKGISLLVFIKDINITVSSPTLLSEYCFILKASDDYSVIIY